MRGVSLWQAACSTPLAGKAGSGVAAFAQLVERLRAGCLGLSLREMVQVVIENSGLKAYYEPEKDGLDRIENLDELVTAAAGFEAEGGFPLAEAAGDQAVAPPDESVDPRLRVLNDFLAHASLEAGEHQAGAGADALQLMTAHAAKGLEFHAVFISGLEEGLFPHENSLNEQAGLEEERRLMYVALTRARRRLYLSFAQSRMLHGQTRYNIASRFLQEIPEELVRRVNAGRSAVFGFGSSTSPTTRPGVPPPFASAPASPWKVGQNVLHPKFGPGVIVSAEGRGADARVQVNFRNAGLKWLALEYAKLTPA
jgi:DNA helicase-2/ATP-dependent DNA helicase PcrA